MFFLTDLFFDGHNVFTQIFFCPQKFVNKNATKSEKSGLLKGLWKKHILAYFYAQKSIFCPRKSGNTDPSAGNKHFRERGDRRPVRLCKRSRRTATRTSPVRTLTCCRSLVTWRFQYGSRLTPRRIHGVHEQSVQHRTAPH